MNNKIKEAILTDIRAALQILDEPDTVLRHTDSTLVEGQRLVIGTKDGPVTIVVEELGTDSGDKLKHTLQSLFYELARDIVTIGKLNKLIRDAMPHTKYTDEELAEWAWVAARRFLKQKEL